MKKLALVVAFALSSARLCRRGFHRQVVGCVQRYRSHGSPVNENVFLNFIHKGSELTGTAGPTAERQWKILNGKVNENSVAFEVQGGGDTQGGPLQVRTHVR